MLFKVPFNINLPISLFYTWDENLKEIFGRNSENFRCLTLRLGTMYLKKQINLLKTKKTQKLR